MVTSITKIFDHIMLLLNILFFRTAPAGMLAGKDLSLPKVDYGNYQITQTGGVVQRSHSHKQKGDMANKRKTR